MLTLPTLNLQQLKDRIDPYIPKGSSIKAMDINTVDLNEFNQVIASFKNIFENNFNGLSTVDKVVCTWTYLAFSLYVHHWGKNPNMHNNKEKLAAVVALDMAAYPHIANTINTVDCTMNNFYKNQKMNFYQKILHINGMLFTFTHQLIESINAESKEKINHLLKGLPLSFSEDKLTIARNKAADRAAQTPSMAESIVNQALLRAQIPDAFSPIKDSFDANYIEPMTGAELDFPLQNKITIETDGAHHNNEESGAHALDHNIKAYALRDEGWTSVRLAVPNVSTSDPNYIDKITPPLTNTANMIAKKLKFPHVLKFKNEYNDLITLQKRVRAEIVQSQKNQYDNQDVEHLLTLMEIDRQIHSWVEERHLEQKYLLPLSPLSEVNNKMAEMEKRFMESNSVKNQLLIQTKDCENLSSNITRLEDEYKIMTKKNNELLSFNDDYKKVIDDLIDVRVTLNFRIRRTPELEKQKQALDQQKVLLEKYLPEDLRKQYNAVIESIINANTALINDNASQTEKTKAKEHLEKYKLPLKQQLDYKIFEHIFNISSDLPIEMSKMEKQLKILKNTLDQKQDGLQAISQQSTLLNQELDNFFKDILPTHSLTADRKDLQIRFNGECENYHERAEQIHQEQMRQEQIRQEQIRQEQIRQEREQERRRQEQLYRQPYLPRYGEYANPGARRARNDAFPNDVQKQASKRSRK